MKKKKKKKKIILKNNILYGLFYYSLFNIFLIYIKNIYKLLKKFIFYYLFFF